MGVILTGIADVISVIGTTFTAMTGNPLLVFYLAAGVLSTGVGSLMTLKGAAH